MEERYSVRLENGKYIVETEHGRQIVFHDYRDINRYMAVGCIGAINEFVLENTIITKYDLVLTSEVFLTRAKANCPIDITDIIEGVDGASMFSIKEGTFYYVCGVTYKNDLRGCMIFTLPTDEFMIVLASTAANIGLEYVIDKSVGREDSIELIDKLENIKIHIPEEVVA